MNEFRLYWRYVKLHARAYVQYKSWPIGMLMVLFTALTDPIDMLVMLDRFGSVGRWSASSLLLMYGTALTAFGLAELFGRGFDYFPLLVRDGSFDRILLRPRSLFVQAITLRFHPHRMMRVFMGLFLMIHSLRAQGAALTGINLALILGALAGGTLVYIGVFIIGSAVSFFTVDQMDWIYAFTNGSYQLAKVPPEYLPKWMRATFQFLVPMLAFSYYPLSSVCGWGEPYALGFLALPIGGAFLAVSLLVFRFGVRHYRSTGS